MNSSSTLAVLCLAACWLASGMALTPAFADDHAFDGHATDNTLSAAQVLQKLDTAGYRSIEKIERKHGNFEVRTTARDGARVKLYVNAQTGDILGRKDSRKTDDRSGNMLQKLMGNCNERRCRDDLVPAPKTAAPVKP